MEGWNVGRSKIKFLPLVTGYSSLAIGHWSLVNGHAHSKSPLNTELLLGIDGGGSKTHVLLADHAGNVLGSGTAPSSNYQAVGMAAAITAVQQAIAAARVDAGIDPQTEIAVACVGLAGVDRAGDRALWEAHLVREPIARRVVLRNDAQVLLAAGTPDGWGLALICGTGSICYGCAPDGRTARAGGWGYLLGDEGSGYDIALHALRLATQTADGRADARALLHAVLTHWQLAEPRQLIAQVYRPGVGRADIAPLASVVVALAAAGDHHATQIVLHSAHELARLIRAVVGQLHLHAPPLALGGGVLGASALLQRAVLGHAGVVLGPPQYVGQPARGAIVLAQRVLRAAGM